MKDEDIDFIPCSLGIIVHTDPLRATQILRYIHEVVEARIIFKLIAPKGEKLWIVSGEEHPNDVAQRREGPWALMAKKPSGGGHE